MDIEAARYTAWQSTLKRAAWDYKSFCESIDGWDIHPVRGGAVLAKGPELHLCVFPNSLSKKALAILRKTINTYGKATTSTELGNVVGATFVTKLGFKKTHVINNIQYWRITNGN